MASPPPGPGVFLPDDLPDGTLTIETVTVEVTAAEPFRDSLKLHTVVNGKDTSHVLAVTSLGSVQIGDGEYFIYQATHALRLHHEQKWYETERLGVSWEPAYKCNEYSTAYVSVSGYFQAKIDIPINQDPQSRS